MSTAFTTSVLHITTGTTETVTDLTSDCEHFLTRAAAGRDGLLNIFVPHATAGSRSSKPARAATTTSSPPCTPCSPPTTAGSTATAAPATAATTYCRPSSRRTRHSR